MVANVGTKILLTQCIRESRGYNEDVRTQIDE